MTERLYYEDAYLLSFTAEVIRCEQAAKGVRVYLDRTAFYPESGGQPADQGWLDEKPIRDVQEDDQGEIYHLLETPPEGTVTTGVVDFERRFDHMQQHTGQHILSALAVKQFGWQTISFHLGQATSTIDLDTPAMSAAELEQILAMANRIIWQNGQVSVGFYPSNEISGLDLRKPTDRTGMIRVIGIEGYDRSACGGTHVRRTGEVGIILVPRLERMRGRVRVHFVCGGRAYQLWSSEHRVLMQLVEITTTGYEELPQKIEKELQTLRQLDKEQLRLKMRLWEMSIPELQERGRKMGAMTVVSAELDESLDAIRFIGRQLTVRYPATVGVLASLPAGVLLVTRGPDLALDLTRLVEHLRRHATIKGGGRPEEVQMGGLDARSLSSLIRQVIDWLDQNSSCAE
ncbi:MAG: hypothetical protein JXQ27_15565 [Acidobacteria bacterium]|nr:hypothetical protein [Acidobacteriota bacterium]